MLSAAAYLLIFLLHLSASTCDAASQNHHHRLLFAGRADDATAPFPAAIYHHHRHHTAKVLSDYHDVHYHPAIMVARRGGPTPRASPSVEVVAGVGGAPPLPVSFAVEARKRDTGAAMEPLPRGEGASSEAFATEQQESASDDDVGVDYAGPRTHPHDPPGPAKSID